MDDDELLYLIPFLKEVSEVKILLLLIIIIIMFFFNSWMMLEKLNLGNRNLMNSH